MRTVCFNQKDRVAGLGLMYEVWPFLKEMKSKDKVLSPIWVVPQDSYWAKGPVFFELSIHYSS